MGVMFNNNPMIDHSTIQRILDATDIVDVVKEFVTLRKAGVNYKGLCPFHNERTPSFFIFPDNHCMFSTNSSIIFYYIIIIF